MALSPLNIDRIDGIASDLADQIAPLTDDQLREYADTSMLLDICHMVTGTTAARPNKAILSVYEKNGLAGKGSIGVIEDLALARSIGVEAYPVARGGDYVLTVQGAAREKKTSFRNAHRSNGHMAKFRPTQFLLGAPEVLSWTGYEFSDSSAKAHYGHCYMKDVAAIYGMSAQQGKGDFVLNLAISRSGVISERSAVMSELHLLKALDIVAHRQQVVNFK